MRFLLLFTIFLLFFDDVVIAEKCGNDELLFAVNAALLELFDDPQKFAALQVPYLDYLPIATPPLINNATCPSHFSEKGFPYPPRSSITKGGTFERILRTGVVIAGGDMNYPPYIVGFPKQIGFPTSEIPHFSFEFVGVEPDLLHDLFTRIGNHYGVTITVQFELINWCLFWLNNLYNGIGPEEGYGCTLHSPSALTYLALGAYDVSFGGIGYTDGRAAYLNFPCYWRPYLGDAFFYNINSFGIGVYPDDFNSPDVSICVLQSSLLIFDQTPEARLVPFPSDFDAVQACINGVCTAVQGDVVEIPNLVSQFDSKGVLQRPNGLIGGAVPASRFGGIHLVLPKDQPGDCN